MASLSVFSAILPRPADGSSPLGRARGALDVLAVNIGRAKPDGVAVVDRQGKDRRQR